MNVDHEIELLKEHVKRLGTDNQDGTFTVKFGVLFKGYFPFLYNSASSRAKGDPNSGE